MDSEDPRITEREMCERGAGWHDESGWTTAELLGNAALAIAALVAIWLVLNQLGLDVVEWIRGEIMGG